MDSKNYHKLKQTYLLSCGSAIVAGFAAINLYPEHHGLDTVGRPGLLMLSIAIVGLLGYTIHQGFSIQPSQSSPETSEPSDTARLKKMSWLWGACALLLSISLLRYPIWEYTVAGGRLGYTDWLSLVLGGALIVFTSINFVRGLRC